MRNSRCILSAAVLLLSSAMGCTTCSSDNGQGPASIASVGPSAGFSPGDRVVVEYARASFFEGTVTVVGSDKLSVFEEGMGAAREVDAANVYRLDPNAEATWKTGDLAICHMSAGRWVACRVEGVEGGNVSVVDEKEEKASLDPKSLLLPTPVTKLNVDHIFERVDKVKAFAQAARGAGELRRPEAWKPRKDESVIVRLGGAYVSAVVQEARRNLLLVKVVGNAEKPRAVLPEDVWPQPPIDAQVMVGGYACLRPQAGELNWKVVRIEEVTDTAIIVRTPTGDKLTASEKDLLPFELRKSDPDR